MTRKSIGISPDLIGLRKGKLTILSDTGKRNKNGGRLWLAVCECGGTVEATTNRFRCGNINTCGCVPRGRRPGVGSTQAHINYLFSAYKKGARVRKLDFNLTKERFLHLIKQPCKYCGEPPLARKSHHSLVGTFAWNGIDRVDNSIGYIDSNCVPCCSYCNFAKAKMTTEVFKKWVIRAYNYMAQQQ